MSHVSDSKDLFDLDSRDLMESLERNFQKKIICVEGYYRYAPMHIVMYQEGIRHLLDEIYLPALIL